MFHHGGGGGSPVVGRAPGGDSAPDVPDKDPRRSPGVAPGSLPVCEDGGPGEDRDGETGGQEAPGSRQEEEEEIRIPEHLRQSKSDHLF